ncbi:MAG: hypothetical protein QOE55_8306, partial [Acidobacteriaceae bacterium]|nr:hypothetical protein [Acidobacteriaceae bacterium]
ETSRPSGIDAQSEITLRAAFIRFAKNPINGIKFANSHL